jgi:hypothetical protein
MSNQAEAEQASKLGNIAIADKKWRDAVKFFTQAIAASDGGDADHYYNRSIGYVNLQQTELALIDVDAAIALDTTGNPKYLRGRIITCFAMRGDAHRSDAIRDNINEFVTRYPDRKEDIDELKSLVQQDAARKSVGSRAIVAPPKLSTHSGTPSAYVWWGPFDDGYTGGEVFSVSSALSVQTDVNPHRRAGHRFIADCWIMMVLEEGDRDRLHISGFLCFVSVLERFGQLPMWWNYTLAEQEARALVQLPASGLADDMVSVESIVGRYRASPYWSEHAVPAMKHVAKAFYGTRDHPVTKYNYEMLIHELPELQSCMMPGDFPRFDEQQLAELTSGFSAQNVSMHKIFGAMKPAFSAFSDMYNAIPLENVPSLMQLLGAMTTFCATIGLSRRRDSQLLTHSLAMAITWKCSQHVLWWHISAAHCTKYMLPCASWAHLFATHDMDEEPLGYCFPLQVTAEVPLCDDGVHEAHSDAAQRAGLEAGQRKLAGLLVSFNAYPTFDALLKTVQASPQDYGLWARFFAEGDWRGHMFRALKEHYQQQCGPFGGDAKAVEALRLAQQHCDASRNYECSRILHALTMKPPTS